MIKAAIVGCGKVADQHAQQIHRIRGATLVAVCDTEPLMAQQMAERFKVERYFGDTSDMLEASKPDVVHITTPPQTHFALGKLCLEAGCSVYIEKPFTLDAGAADELITLASGLDLKVTAGHNALFTPAMIRMRDLVRSGYLGGHPIHMESTYCYDLGDPAYAHALLGNSGHWIRTLPGSLLQNIISHGISKIAEFLTTDSPSVIAHGFTSTFLKTIGQPDIIDEARVIISDQGSTAYFTFSSQIRPSLHQFRLYGPAASLLIDDDHQIVIKTDDKEYKSYLRYFIPPFLYAKQYADNAIGNFRKFVTSEFHLPFDAGLKTLIEAFYASICNSTPPPIPYRDILLTAKIMDDIFAQMKT